MPDAKDNAKLTGDTHPPEVEDLPRQRRLLQEEETPAAATPEQEREGGKQGSKSKPSKAQGSTDTGRGWTPEDPEPKDESRLG